MRAEHGVRWALALIGTLSGCAAMGAPEPFGELGQAIVRPEPQITPYDDWTEVERATYRDGAGFRYGDYYEGTVCFPFGTQGARCGADRSVTLSESTSQTFTLSGTFAPPNLGVTFDVAVSEAFGVTDSATFHGEPCQACWPYVCYAMRIEPRERSTTHGRYVPHSPRTTLSDPALRRFCQDASLECHRPPDRICLDAGVPDAATPPAATDAGPADAATGDAATGDAGRDGG